MNLILASASPRRKQMLSWLGLSFEVLPSSFAEESVECDEVEELVEELALQKALVVARNQPDSIVIGADTLVSLPNGEIIGKAQDTAQATELLQKLSNTGHQITTGVAILDLSQDFRAVFHETSWVTFRQLSQGEIHQYLETAAWQDKAGAYAIQEDPGKFIIGYEGSYTNIMGLPLIRVAEELKALGISIPADLVPIIESQTGQRER